MTPVGFDIAVSRDNFPTPDQMLDFSKRVPGKHTFPSVLNADLERCDNDTLRWVIHSRHHAARGIETESLALKRLKAEETVEGELTPRAIELWHRELTSRITSNGYKLLEIVAKKLIVQRGGEVD